jgi:uncharacterized protein (DUF488 family)
MMADHLAPVTVWTIGHSILPIEQFIDLLTTHGITVLVDVRRFPGSRRHPQYNREPLAATLGQAHIRYESLTDLGGRRVPRPDSPNTAWRHAAFRGYADYMGTPPFLDAAARLAGEATAAPTAVMCAEALWWRCHRALIADYLRAAGARVLHIASTGQVTVHPFTAAARVIDGRLSYAGDPTLGL